MDGALELGGKLAAIRLAQIAAAFLIHLLPVVSLGAGRETDALYAAMTMPQIVAGVLSGSLVYVLVPTFSTTRDDASRRRLGWTVFCAATLSFAGLACVLYAAAPVWVRWTLPGWSGPELDLAVRLSRIQLAGITATGCFYALTAFAHARNSFIWPALSTLCGSLLGLAAMLAGLSRFGIVLAAWAHVLAAALSVALLLPVLGPVRAPDFRSAELRDAWARLKPLVLGSAYSKTDAVVDRLLASYLAAGQLAVLSLAQRIAGTCAGVLVQGFVAPVFPRLARAANKDRREEFLRLRRGRAGLIVALAVLFLLAAAAVGRPALTALFQHGRFGPADVALLYVLLLCLGGYLVAAVWGDLLAKVFYAQGDTRTPTVVGALGFTLGIGLKVLGFRRLGVPGIALGMSAYYVLNAVVMDLILRRRDARG